MRSMTTAAGTGRRTANSRTTGASANGSTRSRASSASRVYRVAWAQRRASSARPVVPSQPSWMAAVTAIRVWLVQTLEVAFSRRMSCSRARSVVT